MLGHQGQLIPVNADVGDLVRHNEVMFRINRRLDVVAHDAGTSGLHRTRIRVSQRNLLVGCRLKLNFNGLERRHLRFQRSDLVLKSFSPELRHGRLLPMDTGFDFFHPPLQLGAGEIPVTIIDGLELAAINRYQGFGEQTELLAQNHKLSTDAADGLAIGFAEIGDGLEVRH